ncbi:MAG: HNH endonuclease signature motif containing protein [Candidatus Poribacteria bacterium]|nr:HNH endonuclease signature motif containing protein [Candidatus Poribacteria bacterium]
MQAKRVSPRQRQRVTERAKNRCEYCLSPAEQTGIPMTIDHIRPQSKEGTSDDDNLCLACGRCNGYKHDRAHGRNPETGRWVRLFHPRRQQWSKHFRWSEGGIRIVGLTACGKATVEVLQMNRPNIVRARRNWVVVGWHPPIA